jgi:hypothetical protein
LLSSEKGPWGEPRELERIAMATREEG